MEKCLMHGHAVRVRLEGSDIVAIDDAAHEGRERPAIGSRDRNQQFLATAVASEADVEGGRRWGITFVDAGRQGVIFLGMRQKRLI